MTDAECPAQEQVSPPTSIATASTGTTSHWTFTDVPNSKQLKNSPPFSIKYGHEITNTTNDS